MERRGDSELHLGESRAPVAMRCLSRRSQRRLVQASRSPWGAFVDQDPGDSLTYSATRPMEARFRRGWRSTRLPVPLFRQQRERRCRHGRHQGVGHRHEGSDRVLFVRPPMSERPAGGQLIYGTPVAETLFAGSTNDTIIAGAGDDLLIGGVGDNVLFRRTATTTCGGQDGIDTMYGGRGGRLLRRRQRR